ncbi:MAG: hypothetical protein P1V20_04960 [Verrucomicrobiales bacterium]|nr:hypothetical protein [Verrucomicrobiales bacterium]
MNGKLIVIEGPDGLGKSTLVQALEDSLTKDGIPSLILAFPGRDVGSLGELIYRIHHDSNEFGIAEVDPAALQCLHIAAHLNVIAQTIKPALAEGKTVVLDRFWWSTLVYGKIAGVDESILTHMIDAEKSMWAKDLPNLAVLLSRKEPFCVRPEHDKWLSLVNEYNTLAEAESSCYPVKVIHLQDGIEEAVPVILQHVSGNHRA